MKPHRNRRSLPLLPLALAATALTLAGPGLAAEAPRARTPQGDQAPCMLCMVGTPAVQWSGNSGSFRVDRVDNRDTSRETGPWALQVQLESTYPDPETNWKIGEYEFSDRVEFDSLPPGGSYANIDSGPIGFHGNKVPAGEYWMFVAIFQKGPQGDWSFHRALDYVVMKDKVTCDGSSCFVGGPCSNTRVAGAWGYTKTGTLFLPTGAATPFATLGTLTLDQDGSLSGANTGSVGGKTSVDVLKGTYEMKPDCTGTTTVEVHDQSGALLRTLVMALVVDEDGAHLRGLVTSLTLPNGVVLPTVITADAKRVFRNGGAGKSSGK